MTTNERLFSRGLLAQFDAAERRRDLSVMVQLLRQVEFSEAEAYANATAVLNSHAGNIPVIVLPLYLWANYWWGRLKSLFIQRHQPSPRPSNNRWGGP